MVTKKDVIGNILACVADGVLFGLTGLHSGLCFNKTLNNAIEVLADKFESNKKRDSEFYEDIDCDNVDLSRYLTNHWYREQVNVKCGPRVRNTPKQRADRFKFFRERNDVLYCKREIWEEEFNSIGKHSKVNNWYRSFYPLDDAEDPCRVRIERLSWDIL